MHRRSSLAALAAACSAPAALGQTPALAQGRTLEVALGDRLDHAVRAADDGDLIVLEPGAHRAQAAVIVQRRLTLRAASGTAVLHADGAHAEGKALLVVRNGEVQIEGLEFRGTRVPHGNGAGIRFEGGSLELRRCRFFDNEMGLLSANRPDAELRLDDCEFGQAPRHPGSLHHLLYVGTMRSLTLRGCRFGGGWRGHLLKSRARRNLILCNQFVDGDDGEASYEIDLPNGGLAWVMGNVVAQGPRPQNRALLAYGAEGPIHADSALRVAHNRFVNAADEPAQFVRHWPDRLPASATVSIEHNRFYGAGDGWGRHEDDNRLLPLDAWRHDPAPPRCDDWAASGG